MNATLVIAFYVTSAEFCHYCNQLINQS